MTVQTETLPTSPDQQAEFRPSQKAPERDNPWEAFVTAVVLAICVYWVLIPIWPHLDSRILGDPETDAIRGMWGFDHIRRSLLPPQTPLWSDLVNFPAGAIFLTLPWTTGIFMAPLGALFGPFVAWNLSIAFMLWALGMSSAWMIKTLTKSWAAGLMLGSFITAQPLLLHSVGDGTAEHIALWTMPIFLGSAWKAIHEHSPKWALLAGVVAFFLAMDSPYHAIYSAVSAVFVLPWAFIRRWSPNQRIELFWSLGTLIVVSLLGALILFVLYQAFPIKMASGADKVALLKMNAADARNWWQHDFTDVFVRDSSLAPTTIPSILIWISVVLITIGAPRSLPWFFAGMLMLILSMGLNGRLPIHLKQWLGGTGVFLGETILYLNNRL
ncbi:MAG: hypothetical protein VX278_06495, partial [Myxococcota bacterium]|nr:hypothetical protein [Myxococcota bacterium]